MHFSLKLMLIAVGLSSLITVCYCLEECGSLYVNEDIETTPGVFVTKQRFIQPYTCPMHAYPSATRCCTAPKYKCCREKYFWEIDFWVGVGIAGGVILVCALLSIVIIWCCCSERCPLYMTCRKEAKMDYIADSNDPATALCPMPDDNDANCKANMFTSSPEPMHVGSPHSSPLFNRQTSNAPAYAPSFLLGSPAPQRNQMNVSGYEEKNKFGSPLGMYGPKTRDQLHVTWNPELEQVRQMSAQSGVSVSSSPSQSGPPTRRIGVSGPPLKSLNSSGVTSPFKHASQFDSLSQSSFQSTSPTLINNSTVQESVDTSSIRRLSANQTDPFLTQGDDFDPLEHLDPTWVTVFGFPSQAASYILQQFSQYGTIETKELPGQCNWMHLKYTSIMEARKALSKNTKVFGDSIMIGVTPCIEKKVIRKHRDEESGSQASSVFLDQSTNLRNISNLNPTSPPNSFYTSRIIPGGGGDTNNSSTMNTSAFSVTSPNRSGMRSLTAAYENAANHYKVAPSNSGIPTKDPGVVSKAWDYMFG